MEREVDHDHPTDFGLNDSGHKCPHCGAAIPEHKLWHDPLGLMHTTRCDACGRDIRCVTEIRLEAA